ncbi:PDZ domain-containing protein 11 isoform X2 [Protopterus annectens]|uniref:PDZ domain-containing protein 11 isoform X2 n=1 Tax=Protopterus annectens TaxID=7888 RepID=UPI001CF97C20|nr:PDZ domain-containing protein 11 isoform X2 [Protopterus annectens]
MYQITLAKQSSNRFLFVCNQLRTHLTSKEITKVQESVTVSICFIWIDCPWLHQRTHCPASLSALLIFFNFWTEKYNMIALFGKSKPADQTSSQKQSDKDFSRNHAMCRECMHHLEEQHREKGIMVMDSKIPYDDYAYPVVFLPSYEDPPAWIPTQELGFNIRGGKASQLGIFISKVIPDSDAHRAGLQEGDQVLTVNEVDFQDIEHGKAVEILKTARDIVMRVRYFPYNYQRQKERTMH